MPRQFFNRWFRILLNEDGFVGKKKKEDEPIEPDVEGDEDEDEDDENKGGMIVDLDEDEDEDEDDEDEDEDEDDNDKQKGKQNKKFAQMRIELKKTKEENDRLKRERQTPASTPHQPAAQPQAQAGYDPKDPRNWSEEQWDAYAKKDWKGAVDLRSQINAENTVKAQTQQNKDEETLAESKRVVSTKHPELNDDNSEKTKIYLQILEENKRYLTDPKGPIHAMRDMEDRMRELGYPEEQIVAAEKRGAKKEQDRQSRVILTSQKGRQAPAGGDRKVKLTKEDLEFCKFNDIDPKEFAKNKLRMQKAKKEVQV